MQSLLNKLFLLIIPLVLTVGITAPIYSQSLQVDTEHISKKNPFNKVDLIQKNKIKWHQAINPLFWIYKGSINFYQKNISVQIAANCVFETTCSRFSKKLVNEFGVVGGMLLSIERLSRCNRVTFAESSPLELNEEGKIVERIEEYHIH